MMKFCKGTSENYVDYLIHYFEHLPKYLWLTLLLGQLGNSHIWRTTYLPPFVNIVIESPLKTTTRIVK